MAKKSKLGLSSPLLYIVLGALLVIFKSQMLSWAMTIAGIFFLVMGIIDLTKGRTMAGSINIIIGVAILVLGWLVLNVVLLVLGVLIAIKGVTELIDVLKRKRRNIIQLLFPILTIVIGVSLALGDALGDIIAIVGILLIVDGILGLVGSKK